MCIYIICQLKKCVYIIKKQACICVCVEIVLLNILVSQLSPLKQKFLTPPLIPVILHPLIRSIWFFPYKSSIRNNRVFFFFWQLIGYLSLTKLQSWHSWLWLWIETALKPLKPEPPIPFHFSLDLKYVTFKNQINAMSHTSN